MSIELRLEAAQMRLNQIKSLIKSANGAEKLQLVKEQLQINTMLYYLN